MAMTDVEMIIHGLTEKLKDNVPQTVLTQIDSAVREVMAGYDVTRIISAEQNGKDYMIDAFLDSLTVGGRSKKTIERYRYIIARMLKTIGLNTAQVTKYHLRSYLTAEKNRGISESTIRGDCWVFSSYFGWLQREGLITKNPMWNMGTIKVPVKVKEVFTDVEIEMLKMACTTERNIAIVCFLKSTGCRVGEVASLTRSDVNLEKMECLVNGKGGKQRTVYMDAVTVMHLRKYLERRDDDNPSLFVGCRHESLTTYGIRSMLKRVARSAGVSNVYPHKFRRTEITELVKRGMPIEQVRTLAGHEKLDTTIGYVVVDHDNIKNSYRRLA